MKRNLTLLAMLLAVVSGVTAQEPIAMDGKKWFIKVGHSYYFSDVHMWIEGDTIISGITYKKLYKHTIPLWEDNGDTFEVGYCHQDGDKYWQNGQLMFDFGLQLGDMFTVDNNLQFMVTNVSDTVLTDGVRRKCIIIKHNERTDVWVEGIGSLTMGIYTNNFTGYGMMKTLLSCSYNEQYLYDKESTRMNHIPLSSATPYYDLIGRPVANPTRGVYIKDGKKIAVD